MDEEEEDPDYFMLKVADMLREVAEELKPDTLRKDNEE